MWNDAQANPMPAKPRPPVAFFPGADQSDISRPLAAFGQEWSISPVGSDLTGMSLLIEQDQDDVPGADGFVSAEDGRIAFLLSRDAGGFSISVFRADCLLPPVRFDTIGAALRWAGRLVRHGDETLQRAAA